MILTTHALAGAVIGKNIENPLMIIITSVVFHYVLDTVRHGEYVSTFDDKSGFKKTWWKIGIDLLGSLAVAGITIYFGKNDFVTIRNVLFGIFFSMVPDAFTLVYWKTKWKFLEFLYKFHIWMHRLPRLAPERKWNFRNELFEIMIFCFIFALWFF